ncbi:glycosyltransferase [Gammaproteobacteria bacterium]|jgi:glycosyltransferase involved in cell wall biosynthesis|nr:glycosyltransferase [Gammaproteobacteria bacterium]MDC0128998.1 glycosyltransferase [Gammaproteobacteria bacterium]
MTISNPHPLITVMVPCFNQAGVIEGALASIFKQSYKNFEVIISDDCSTDNTNEIVLKFIELNKLNHQRIKYFKNKTNLGYLKNYHCTLFTRAKGEWAINLDGDDFFIDRNFFQNAVNKIQKNPSANLVCANYKEFYPEKNLWIPIKNTLPEIMTSSQFLGFYGQGKVLWNHNALMYKTSVAKKIGFYWDSQQYKNDWESFLKLSTTGHIIFYDEFVSAWVQHSANLTGGTALNKFQDNFFLIQELNTFITSKDISSKIRKKLLFYLVKINVEGPATLILRKKEYSKFFKFISLSIKEFKLTSITILLNPIIWMKFLLALSPSLYFFIKKISRGAFNSF